MSKGTQNLSLTRERKIALPVILVAAREHLATHHGVGKGKAQLEAALKAFD